MLDFYKKLYKGIIVFITIVIELSAIMAGYSIGVQNGSGFWGIIIGLIIGIIVNAILGGFIAAIISIDENLENINEQLYIIRKNNSWFDEDQISIQTEKNKKIVRSIYS